MLHCPRWIDLVAETRKQVGMLIFDTFCCMWKGLRVLHADSIRSLTLACQPCAQGACKQESFMQEHEGHITANTNRAGLRHKDVCLDRGPCTNPIHSPTLNSGDETR